MYTDTTAAAVTGDSRSETFAVTVGLRQGSALSPMLFTVMMEFISRKVKETEPMKKLMYADDLVVMEEGDQKLQMRVSE